MELTFVIATVENPADIKKRKEVEFMVDSGAVYSIVPRTILQELGIVPHSIRTFILPNGVYSTRINHKFYFFPFFYVCWIFYGRNNKSQLHIPPSLPFFKIEDSTRD